MQKIGAQIQLDKSKEELIVEIHPNISDKNKLILNAWLLLWTACGLAVVSQLFVDSYAFEEKVFILIYLAFWAYLEFKVLYAFRWNRKGIERIELKDGKFAYTKLIGKRGLPFECEWNDLSLFHYESSTETGLWNDINKAAWMVGGEVIEYKFKHKIRRLGMKLNKKDALKLVDQLNRFIQSKRQNAPK